MLLAGTNIVKIRLVCVVKDGFSNWFPIHRELIEAILHPGLLVDWHNEESPLTEIKSLEDAHIAGKHVVHAAQEAQRLGFDAVAVDCLLQPGVKEAREKTTIPVIGAAEASLAIALKMGRKPAFVVGGDAESLEKVIQYLPAAECVVSCVGVGGSPLEFSAKGDYELVSQRMKQCLSKAINNGADVIIGYGSLALINELRQYSFVPVISPIQAVVLYAEHVVRVHRASKCEVKGQRRR